MSKPLESVLEILLITYNRSACLDNTLRQLEESPFSKCRLTVLDNCSADDTPNITAKYKDKFPNFRIIRHSRNIGGDYNFLRAIELSASYYTWVLCDDDNYDFSRAADVIRAIESCTYDLVYVASRSSVQLGCNGFGDTSAKRLTLEGARYHRACAFWPALIFKTELYDNSCYHNAPFLFPSFKFISKSIENDFSVYVSEYPIVIRSDANPGEQSNLALYKEWVELASLIRDPKLKEYVIEQWTDKGFMKTLIFWFMMDRTRRAEGYFKRFIDILFALSPKQRCKLLLLLPFMVVPLPVGLLIRTRELVYRFMGHRDAKTLPPLIHDEHR